MEVRGGEPLVEFGGAVLQLVGGDRFEVGEVAVADLEDGDVVAHCEAPAGR